MAHDDYRGVHTDDGIIVDGVYGDGSDITPWNGQEITGIQSITNIITHKVVVEALRKELEEAMEECLIPREEAILRLRFGFDDGISRTFEEVGIVYNISTERVRQIERNGLLKLIDHCRKSKMDKNFDDIVEEFE